MEKEELFHKIYEVSKELKTTVYIVGGYVRDELLRNQYGPEYDERFVVEERDPIKPVLKQEATEDKIPPPIISKPKRKEDLDFVVEGGGVEVAKKFDEKFEIGSLVLFEEFDTARYVIEEENGGYEIEFAGAREESYKEESRKPQVKPANLKEDLHRRDFTVNAMAREVKETGLGEIIDLFGGQEDLKKEILKTPHDPNETFREDPLRMLRAARFASKLGFDIEENTYKAIEQHRDSLSIVSMERVREEFFKLLLTPTPSVGLWILYETKLINEFLPEVSEFSRKETRDEISHKDNLAHTFNVVDNAAARTNNHLLIFAALLHDIGKPETKEFDPDRGWTFDMHEHVGRKIVYEIGERLKMSKKNTRYVADLVRWHQQPVQLIMGEEEVSDSALRRLVVELGENIDDLLKLGRSDITTGSSKRKERYLENYDKLEEGIIKVIQRDKLREFQSPVSGDEIMDICGLNPSPTVGKIKKEIEEAILEGKIPNEYGAAKDYLEDIKDDFLKQAKDWELKK